ncbi:MAG: TldD/PmbA family protein [Promethearchaeota archaeon]
MSQVEDLLENVAKVLEGAFYGDVRLERAYGTSVSKTKVEESITSSSHFGICIRIFSDNKWHYLGYAHPDTQKILDETRRKVEKVGNRPSSLYLQKSWKTDSKVNMKENPADISPEEKLKSVREIFSNIMDAKMIINASTGIGSSKNEMIFMNTEGCILRQELNYMRVVLSAIAKENGRIEDDYFVLAKQGGYELFTGLDIDEKIESVTKGAKELLSAKMIDGGRWTIITDPEISGVIAHESFGHGLEADQVLRGRSYLAGLQGKKIVSELVSMHDNSALEGERGFFFFDHEGIKSADTTLVENGVLVDFIHDRQSAAFMNTNATGSARAQDFSRKVYVRMSNTYVSPGEWKHDELVEDTQHGFYLVKASHGMEDPLGGNLQVSARKTLEIKNGEFTGQLFKGVAISGKVLEFLNNVDAVTNDFEISGSGCGKGHEDYVPVSTGGPYMRIKNAIIG